MLKVAIFGLLLIAPLSAAPINSDFLELSISIPANSFGGFGVPSDFLSPSNTLGPFTTTGTTLSGGVNVAGWVGSLALVTNFDAANPTMPLTLSLTQLTLTCENTNCPSIGINFEGDFDFDASVLDNAPYRVSLTGHGTSALVQADIATDDRYFFDSPNGNASPGNYNYFASGILALSNRSFTNAPLVIDGTFDIAATGLGNSVVLPNSFEIQVGSPAGVPEPGTLPLFAAGLLVGAAAWAWRCRTARG